MSYFCYVHNWASPQYDCPSCNKERVQTYATDSTTVSLPIATLKDHTSCVNCERLEASKHIQTSGMETEIKFLQSRLEVLERENKMMRECIEFYATFQPRQHPEGYYEIHISPGMGGEDRFGTRARDCLKAIEKDCEK